MYSRLKIDKNGAWNIVLVVCLVEENVFTIPSFRRPFFKDALIADPVLGTEALPKHGAHWTGSDEEREGQLRNIHTLVSALPQLNGDDLSRHFGVGGGELA